MKKKSIFKTLDFSGGHITKDCDPERWEVNKGNSTIPRHIARKEFPGINAGRRNTGGVWQSPWIEELEV